MTILDRRAASSWYVVRVVSRAEDRARASLSAAGFGAYVPIRKVDWRHRRSKVWRTRTEVLMPGYCFVEFPQVAEGEWYDRGRSPTWRGLKSCTAVLHPLGQIGEDGGLVPIPVPAGVVETLMAAQASMAFDDTRQAADHRREARRGSVEDLRTRYPVGSEVIARYGPFAGITGSVVGVSPQSMVEALLDVFGRMTPVSFPVDQLEGVAA